MEFHTFQKAIERAQQLDIPSDVHLCGLGEPLLHPRVVDCVHYLTEKGLYSDITTNGFMLTKDLSRELIDAGLKEIQFSASGIDHLYEKIHNLDFETTKRNVLDFLNISRGKCWICISVTVCDENKNEVEGIKKFWKREGINRFVFVENNNRGGAMDTARYFVKSDNYYTQAREILEANSIDTLCEVPHIYIFIGWDGNYYMCCNDYGKRHPLGNVFDSSIEEINRIKKKRFRDGLDICCKCDQDKTNKIREILFRVEKGEASESAIHEKVKGMKKSGLKGRVID